MARIVGRCLWHIKSDARCVVSQWCVIMPSVSTYFVGSKLWVPGKRIRNVKHPWLVHRLTLFEPSQRCCDSQADSPTCWWSAKVAMAQKAQNLDKHQCSQHSSCHKIVLQTKSKASENVGKDQTDSVHPSAVWDLLPLLCAWKVATGSTGKVKGSGIKDGRRQCFVRTHALELAVWCCMIHGFGMFWDGFGWGRGFLYGSGIADPQAFWHPTDKFIRIRGGGLFFFLAFRWRICWSGRFWLSEFGATWAKWRKKNSGSFFPGIGIIVSI